MKRINKLLASLILSLPFFANSCGNATDYGAQPCKSDNCKSADDHLNVVYGPAPVDTNSDANSEELPVYGPGPVDTNSDEPAPDYGPQQN